MGPSPALQKEALHRQPALPERSADRGSLKNLTAAWSVIRRSNWNGGFGPAAIPFTFAMLPTNRMRFVLLRAVQPNYTYLAVDRDAVRGRLHRIIRLWL